MPILPALPAIASAVGSVLDFFGGQSNARRQEKLQREFAQNAISWKVADANRAGVHPLYALGAPTMSYSPVSVGGGSSMGDVGQDIGRAIGAGMSKDGQVSAFDAAVQELTLKKFGLENELLASQIAKMRQELLSKPALPPVSLPGGGRLIPGQSSTAQVVQDQYGDLVENFYGTGRLIYDALDNLIPGQWIDSHRSFWKGLGSRSRGRPKATGYRGDRPSHGNF